MERSFKNIIGWCKKHPYCCIAIYVTVHTALFFALSNFVEPKYIIHSPIDELIPFCEYFALPYVLWYVAFVGSMLLFAAKERKSFCKLIITLFIGSTICCFVYLFFQNTIILPQETTKDNVFAWIAKLVWSGDNPTNACPSLHVFTSVVIGLVILTSEYFKKHKLAKWSIVILMLLICLSTMFIKQHSVIDVFCGGVMAMLIWAAVEYIAMKKLS